MSRFSRVNPSPHTVEKAPSEFGNLLCCYGGCMALASFGITLIFQPIQTCNPQSTVPDYALQLDESAVQLKSAYNDCCCHIAHSTTTVPLDKIQDVQLQETWIHTLFGVKKVNIQTAGMNATADGVPKPEISAAFLREPERVRESIAMAARLHKEAMSAPGQAAMRRTAAPGTANATLDALQSLTIDGTLTEQEASSIKVAVLAGDGNALRKLQEMRKLLDVGRITRPEFDAIKSRILATLM